MEVNCQSWKRVVRRRAQQFHLLRAEEAKIVGQTLAISSLLLRGGEWAPSERQASVIATHRPFTAGSTEAPLAAPNLKLQGI